MASNKFIELEAGIDSWFKTLYILLATLAVLAILTTHASGSIKLITLVALFLYLCFSSWQIQHQIAIHQVRIYTNGTVTLISRDGEEFPGVLENDNWTTRWVSMVTVGRFDRWGRQRLLVCASRNDASNYRQLLKRLRLGAPKQGILGPG